jgi:putative membrane protein
VIGALGVAVLIAAWLAPHDSFVAHMTVHMSVVAIAAPMIAYAWARGPYDLVRPFPRVFSPLLASVVELFVVWVWHAPALHHAARHLLFARVLEQGSFLASGLWLWLSVFGGDDRARRGEGILALLLTSMHMTLLGALLALPPRALYGHGGADALSDQHWGGAIMLLVGGVVYLAGGLALARGLLREAAS